MSSKLHNIAVLIDADNASPHNIGYILQQIATLGRITCKNIYGDWGNAHIKGWQEALLKYAIDPMQHFAYVKGKNATDIGMVIDAMDLLYSAQYDGFCIVSSDSDFTALALRIRKNNIKVFGFGKNNTVNAFTQACDTFYYVEDLLPSAPIAQPVPKPIEAMTARTVPQKADNKTIPPKAPKITKPVINNTSANSTKSIVKKWEEQQLKCDTRLLNSLRASINNNPKAKNERWIAISAVSLSMKKHYPSFDPNKYGYSKITSLIKNISLFETKVVNSGFYVREKNASQTKTSSKSSDKKATTPFTREQLQSQTHLIGVINKLIRENPNSNDGWSNISYIYNQINQNYKNIKLSRYGYTKLSDLIKVLAVHEIRSENNTVLIRLHTEKSTLGSKTKKTALELIREYAKVRN